MQHAMNIIKNLQNYACIK